MHGAHGHGRSTGGPHTGGVALHGGPLYDVLEVLLGFGVDRRGSRTVVELASVKPGDRVLDVGCGTGNLTLTAERYAGESGRVHGIDASPEMIEVARKKARRRGSKAVFAVGLAEKLDFPESTFDIVISRLVIHHFPDDVKRLAFAEIYRVLKPGGVFFAADFRPPDTPIRGHLAAVVFGPEMMRSDVRDVLPMLVDAGFVQTGSGQTASAILAFVCGKKCAGCAPITARSDVSVPAQPRHPCSRQCVAGKVVSGEDSAKRRIAADAETR